MREKCIIDANTHKGKCAIETTEESIVILYKTKWSAVAQEHNVTSMTGSTYQMKPALSLTLKPI